MYAVVIQRRELSAQREELKKSAEANHKSQVALNHQNDLQALSSLLDAEIHMHNFIYKSATPGKMALKARVVDAKTGNALTVKQSIIRYLGYSISSLPLGLGHFWIGWDKKKQAWHDKLAGTVVIRPINKGVENVNFSEKNS